MKKIFDSDRKPALKRQFDGEGVEIGLAEIREIDSSSK
jgi:hypothetical protein